MSPTGRYTTLVPLICILVVSAIKEIAEDIVSVVEARTGAGKVGQVMMERWGGGKALLSVCEERQDDVQ